MNRQKKKLNKNEWDCRTVPHSTAAGFIRRFHYAGGTSNTSQVRLGLFRKSDFFDTQLMGSCLWMWAPIQVTKQYKTGKTGCLSLSRLAIHPDVPTNGASFLIGQSIKWIKKNRPGVRLLVTYADSWKDHSGQIYKATNWEYLGLTTPSPRWTNSAGQLVSRYCCGKSRRYEEMDRLYTREGKFGLHKFIMWIR